MAVKVGSTPQQVIVANKGLLGFPTKDVMIKKGDRYWVGGQIQSKSLNLAEHKKEHSPLTHGHMDTMSPGWDVRLSPTALEKEEAAKTQNGKRVPKAKALPHPKNAVGVTKSSSVQFRCFFDCSIFP